MSVERRPSGTYKVRWRDAAGHPRARTFTRKGDAAAFDIEVKRRKQTGELVLLDAGRQPLAEFAREWWDLYAAPTLAPKTLEVYAHLWDRHVHPRLGRLTLRELTVQVIQAFAVELADDDVGAASRRKTLALLGGVLQRAVEWNRIQANPVRAIRLPAAPRSRTVVPLAPKTVETMRWPMNLRDATIVSILAYAGLRPGEALGLCWSDIGERTLRIERAVTDGVITTTKTGHRRTVRLAGPLRADLMTWKTASADDELVFARTDGQPWREHDWRNWRRRTFDPIVKAVGLNSARPYDLRHSAASLWLHEGRSVVEVAAWMGHRPTMTLDTYAHVIADLADDTTCADQLIRAARLAQPSHLYPMLPTAAAAAN